MRFDIMAGRPSAAGRVPARARFALAALLLALASPSLAVDLQYSFLRDDLTDPLPAGGTIIYEVQLLNADADTALDVRSIYDVPAGTTPVSLPPFCTAVGARIECLHGDLVGTLPPAGGSPVDFELRFATTVPGTVTLRGAVGTGVPPAAALPLPAGDGFFAGDTDPANNQANQNTTVTSGGNLTISKSGTPDPVVGGAEVTYTVTVENLGPSDSAGVRVIDTLPTATSFVAGSASGAGWTFSASGGTLTATRASTLANGASAQFTFRARVNAGSGTITNAATVDTTGPGATPDPIPGNNTATADTVVNPGADLTVSKTVTPAPAVAAEVVTFTLRPRNLGPSPAADAVLVDTLPPGFTLVGVISSPAWTCPVTVGATSLTCTRTSFPVGATEDIQFTALAPATVPAGGQSATNSATLTSSVADPVAGNNTGTVTFTVLPLGADLSLQSKAKTPQIVPVWDGIGPDTASRMTSTIVVRNNGPLAASANVQVADTLAAGEEFVSSSGPWTCAVSGTPPGQSVLCTFNGPYPVNVGQTLSGGNALTIVTRAIAAGTLTNTACTGGTGGSGEPDTADGTNQDAEPGNDCSGATARSTNESADLTISKQTSTPVGADKVITAAEGSVTYTLEITNTGSNATGGIVMDDPIPGFINGRTPVPSVSVPAGFTCTSAATVTCRSVAGFQLAPGDSRTIVITVQRPLNDSSAIGSTVCNGSSVPQAFCNTAQVRIDGLSPDAVGESNAGNNSAQDWVQIDRVANVQTTSKSIISGNPGRAGVDTQYRIDYRNDGPSAVPGVTFSDVFTLPANDNGFVLVSATRTPGSVACTVTPGPGITATSTAGGMSYSNAGNPSPGTISIVCPSLNLANQQVEAMLVTIRPNFASGPGLRSFANTATFSLASGNSGNDALGSFDFNSDPSAADDEKSALLDFEAGQVDLIANKTDLVDPIGFDPFDFNQNAITYRVRVTNQGPSVATNVRVQDVISPPAGRSLRFIGDSTVSTGPFAVSACSISTGSNPVVGPATLTLDCLMPGVGFSPNVDGIVAAGSTTELFLRFQYESQPAAGGDTLTDVATATANEVDSNPANDVDDESTSIRSRADLAVSKLASTATPDPDPASAAPSSVASVSLFEPHFWVIDAVNNGPGASLSLDRAAASQLSGTGTVIVDTLPTGIALTGAATWQKSGPALVDATPDGSGACSQAGSVLTCAVGDVTPGGRVRIIVPVRWTTFPAGGTVTNTATVSTEQVDPNPGNNTTTANLAITRSSLTGIVFQDRDRAGANGGTPQAAASEPRINGVQIRLTGTDAFGNAVNRTANSNASGVYTFNNLAPSDASGYTLTQTQPAGFRNGPIDPPAAGAGSPTLGGSYAASINGNGDSQYTAIPVATAQTGSNYNFPELRQPTLSGFVYIDVNGNGTREAGTDLPVAGTPVRLLDAGNGVEVATTNTDASGAYQFTALEPLTVYTLEQALPTNPTGLINGPINPGLIGGAACATGCTAQADTPAADTDRIADIDLGSGVDGTVFNFGEIQTAAISGQVYVDADRNNALDPSDTVRIPGVTVRLVFGADCATGTELASTVTDAAGGYRFDGVTAFRDYLICETQPVGYGEGNAGGVPGSSVISIVNLPAGGSTDNDFGELVGSIAGSVYIDANDNGDRDAGELGIADVPMVLTGTNAAGTAVNLNVLTDSDGNYRFVDLLAADAAGYRIDQGTIPPAAGTLNDGQNRAGDASIPGVAGTVGVNVTTGIGPAAGQQAIGYLFGKLQATSIRGVVYVDADRNNALDPSDTVRIPGVTVRLVFGADCATGTELASTVTDAAGGYRFDGVTAFRDYLICETQPVGYGEGNAGGVPGSSVISISNLPETGSIGNDFGEWLGSITGRVYLDANNNGLPDPGEPGLPGVRVALAGTAITGATIDPEALTDADGRFRFEGLLQSDSLGYRLTEQAEQPIVDLGGTPTTTFDGVTRAGTLSGVPLGSATPVETLPSAITAIVLPAAGDSVDNLFGELLPVAITGLVFLDNDDDGSPNLPEDVGFANQPIQLDGTDDLGRPVSLGTVTDSGGRFAFEGLRPGVYRLTQPEQPSNTIDGQVVAGSAGGTPSATGTTPSTIADIDLGLPGRRSDDNRFAEVPTRGLIAGRVWLDRDDDGVFDPDERGIPGVSIVLTGTDLAGNPIERTTRTDAQGEYRFDELPPGRYTVTEPEQPTDTLDGRTLPGTGGGNATPPGSLPSEIREIVLAANRQAVNNDFAELPLGAIAGRVYADNDNDGLPDPGEPGLPGVTVVLTGINDLGNPVERTATTDGDGRYRFDGLRPGTYRLTEPDQPAGTLNGITTPGQIDGTTVGSATDTATLPSAISQIVLGPGDESVENNFGELPDAPDLKVSKRHEPARFTVGNPGRYLISVRNAGLSASQGEYEVRDRLPVGVVLAGTPQGSGWQCLGAAGEDRFLCRASRVLAPGETSPDRIEVSVVVGPEALAASPIDNAVLVEGGGEIDANRPDADQRDAFDNAPETLPVCDPDIVHDVCRDPVTVVQSAALSGSVWFDTGSTPVLRDVGDQPIAGWIVEVLDADGQVVGSIQTGPDGRYRIVDLPVGVPLLVRFRDPESGVVWGLPVNGETVPGAPAPCDPDGAAANGSESSCTPADRPGVNDTSLGVVLAPGQELVEQSLPIQPGGVVYDALGRSPVPGAEVSLSPVGSCPGYDPARHVANAGLGGYRIEGERIAMTVGGLGVYRFLFLPDAPAACRFRIEVRPPSGFSFVSELIAPQPQPLDPPGTTGGRFEVQPQPTPPTAPVGPGTAYHLEIIAGSGEPAIVNNHIPLDPATPTGLAISKTADRQIVEVGDTVLYTITVRHTGGGPLPSVSVLDRLPAGFVYIDGSAAADGRAIADPAGAPGPQLAFDLGAIAPGGRIVLNYRLRVGVGSQQGDGVNVALAYGCGGDQGCIDPVALTPFVGSIESNVSRYRVRISGGVFTEEACVLGKIFVDCNVNHVQDPEELGIPGVRLYFQDGTWLISDSEGKYSYCGLRPRSHVIKVDPSTLPRGARLTTSSNRNLGDPGSLFLDLKIGELHRADFIEGSCSATVLEQVKARRTQGEVSYPETEVRQGPLRFESKPAAAPTQATDSARQGPIVAPRGSPATDGNEQEGQP